ncbi:hypothetical protein EAE96_002879 [Botrytis aclada]|nr:hypothetical protein EAE96_002879 [Botrytis aclada]
MANSRSSPPLTREEALIAEDLRVMLEKLKEKGGDTRCQETARNQNPVAPRRQENRGLGSANFSSMESNQEAEEENRGGGGGKKSSSKRQETEKERQKRLEKNERAKIRYREKKRLEEDIMKGNDPIKKREVEQKILKKYKRSNLRVRERKKLEKETINGDDPIKKREVEQKIFKKRKQSNLHYRKEKDREDEIMNENDPIKKRKVEQKRLERREGNRESQGRRTIRKAKPRLGGKQQEDQIMEEDALQVRTTVGTTQFWKDGTNNHFQQKTTGRRKAQTQVEEEEEEEEDNDEDEDESEECLEGEWKNQQDDE